MARSRRSQRHFRQHRSRKFQHASVGSSSPVIEYVIRPHVNILCVLGSFVHCWTGSICWAQSSRAMSSARKLRKGITWACETHLTGTRDVETFLERKRWGENWRSSLWATLLGVCGVLCRSVLDPTYRLKINDVRGVRGRPFHRHHAAERLRDRHQGGGKCAGRHGAGLGDQSAARPSPCQKMGTGAPTLVGQYRIEHPSTAPTIRRI